jgi:WD40 repeat protein
VDRVTGCAFSPDGTWAASTSLDHSLIIWDVASGETIRTLTNYRDRQLACAISPDGSWIVSASDEHLTVWDPATGAELRTLTAPTALVRRAPVALAVSPDGTWIASADEDHDIVVWDAATGDLLRTFTGHTDAVRGCAIGPDGTWIASGSEDHTVRLWSASRGRELLFLPVAGDVNCVAVHPREPIVVCGLTGGALHVVELHSGAFQALAGGGSTPKAASSTA